MAVLESAGKHRDRSPANILGVEVSAINMDIAENTIQGWIARNERRYVCVADVHSIMQGYWDPEFRRLQNNAGMVTPDGMPLVWVMRARGLRHVRRVYGSQLMLHVCREGVRHGRRHFLYGGAPGIADALAARLRRDIPGIDICGTLCPPFRALTPEEDAAAVAAINAARPDIVWVGLGAPKQELWMKTHLGRIEAPILIGVGAAYDFLSGAKREAPDWMRNAGLEWVHRLASEPGRLWKRYLTCVPAFLVLIALQSSHLRNFPVVR